MAGRWEREKEQGRADARAGRPLFWVGQGDEGQPDIGDEIRRRAQDAELVKMAGETQSIEVKKEAEKQASDEERARGDAERYASMYGIPFENAFRTLSQVRGLADPGQPDTPTLDEGTETRPPLDYHFAPTGFTAPEAPASQDTYRYINPTTERQWQAPSPGQWGLPEEWQSAGITGPGAKVAVMPPGHDYAQWQPQGFLQDAARLSTSFGIPIRDAVTSLAMSRGKTPGDFLGNIIPQGIGSLSPPESDISSAGILPQLPGGEEGFVFWDEPNLNNPLYDDYRDAPLVRTGPEGPSESYVGLNQPAAGLALYPSNPTQQGGIPSVLRANGGTVTQQPLGGWSVSDKGGVSGSRFNIQTPKEGLDVGRILNAATDAPNKYKTGLNLSGGYGSQTQSVTPEALGMPEDYLRFMRERGTPVQNREDESSTWNIGIAAQLPGGIVPTFMKEVLDKPSINAQYGRSERSVTDPYGNESEQSDRMRGIGGQARILRGMFGKNAPTIRGQYMEPNRRDKQFDGSIGVPVAGGNVELYGSRDINEGRPNEGEFGIRGKIPLPLWRTD